MGGKMIYNYPANYNPIKWFFGDGYTIFTRMCELGGNEIHVQASKPVRNVCMRIINGIGGVWWTTIEPSNKKAINLCIKCGFEFVEKKTVIDSISGKIETNNIYRRVASDNL